MPWIEDAGERLRMAAGAALAFKTLKHPNLVVAYVRGGEVAEGDWRGCLGSHPSSSCPSSSSFCRVPEAEAA